MCGRFTRKGSPKRLLSSLGGEVGEENWIDEIFYGGIEVEAINAPILCARCRDFACLEPCLLTTLQEHFQMPPSINKASCPPPAFHAPPLFAPPRPSDAPLQLTLALNAGF